ncbi:IMPACT family protein [Muriicola marianensis]|uniref:Impact N-terminal domain-containing protein n=1 Tax=Muriicola marianensis TaxID=1324801 RepID=A0ABQ1QMT0_9FLAO|nr:YigZ family protein [Muriicola marianensis]GGD37127.1 hypothetical protein GCM10011361_00260 [Muriicola marianensis]
MDIHQYRTLAAPIEGVILKEKKSKFMGYAFPVSDETEIAEILTRLKQEHGKANHICYAWQLGANQKIWRVNDDGEPKNSAGMPIFGQIQAFELTDILLAVVRYFGGTKLGVGGLISAYGATARLTLEEGKIITRTIMTEVFIQFDYEHVHKVMQLIKRNQIGIRSEENGLRAGYTLDVPISRFDKALRQFRNIPGVEVRHSRSK